MKNRDKLEQNGRRLGWRLAVFGLLVGVFLIASGTTYYYSLSSDDSPTFAGLTLSGNLTPSAS